MPATVIRWATFWRPSNLLNPRKDRGHQVVMNGNEALAYGLIAAGVRFGAAYPITPWSEIMELLRRELPKYGGTFVQCEDEIASALHGHWRGLGGARRGHRFQRSGHLAQNRSASAGPSWPKCRWSLSMSSAAALPPACRPASSNPT